MQLHTMLDLLYAEILQALAPIAELHDHVVDVAREQNVPGIAAIHHALRGVDSPAHHVGALANVLMTLHRTAVYSHSQRKSQIPPQRTRNLHRALDRRPWIPQEHQRHAVTGWKRDQLILIARPAEFRAFPHHFLKKIKQLRLLFDGLEEYPTISMNSTWAIS